ncbi:MAG TPA: aspartate dehydrogenase [Stellaceae bacterium]|nr:aspartate dehydrogenase [Stellaceae bacterium]
MTVDTAVIGLGAIGFPVALALYRGIPGLKLVAVSAARLDVAAKQLAAASIEVPVLGVSECVARAALIVECVPPPAFRAVAETVLGHGRTMITVSGAALLDSPELVALAERTGARITLVTGALLGLDAVRAAAEGQVTRIRLVTRKPPLSLEGAPYMTANGIDVASIRAPTCIFQGSAREAAKAFPSNVNVAAALSLAGIGPDKTEVEVWADPGVERNVHSIEVDAGSAAFSMSIQNVPSVENPSTSSITPLSVIAALRAFTATLRVGT